MEGSEPFVMGDDADEELEAALGDRSAWKAAVWSVNIADLALWAAPASDRAPRRVA